MPDVSGGIAFLTVKDAPGILIPFKVLNSKPQEPAAAGQWMVPKGSITRVEIYQASVLRLMVGSVTVVKF